MSDILISWPGNISPVICFHNWRVIPGCWNHMKATHEVTPKRRGGFEGFRPRHVLGIEAVSHLSLSLQPQFSLTCHQNWISDRNLTENRCTPWKLKRLSRKLKLHHVGGDVLSHRLLTVSEAAACASASSVCLCCSGFPSPLWLKTPDSDIYEEDSSKWPPLFWLCARRASYSSLLKYPARGQSSGWMTATPDSPPALRHPVVSSSSIC